MIKENISLKELNTFKVGGKAKYFCEINSFDELSEVAEFIKLKNIPFIVLGWGSNLLVSDKDYPGIVIKISAKNIEWEESEHVFNIAVDSGMLWDDLVKKSVKKGLFGLENLSGIPGTVGAAPIQNIGAYGSEIKDTLTSIEVFNLESKNIETLSLKDCNFSYRDSFFKSAEAKKLIITRVFLRLPKKGNINISYKDLKKYFGTQSKPTVSEIRAAVLKIRSEKFPSLKKFGTAGSFFKNPIVSGEELKKLELKFSEIPHFPLKKGEYKLSAAWILDKVLNLKGQDFNQVGFFEKQPLVVVNLGKASADEIKKVTDKIILKVKNKLGIILEREVTLVGEFDKKFF